MLAPFSSPQYHKRTEGGTWNEMKDLRAKFYRALKALGVEK